MDGGSKTAGDAAMLVRRTLADEVADALRRLIHAERHAMGDTLPAMSTLAERLEVSRAVVREAVERLADDGVLEQTPSRRWTILRPLADVPPSVGEGDMIQHSSLADRAAAVILRMILDDGYAEGDPLPPVRELAERYGVSVLVIREALASLAARGVLDRRQGREATVALPSYDILGGIIRVRTHLSSITVDELLACREPLETQAAELAATRDLPACDKREALAPHIEAMSCAKTTGAFNDHDLAFHLSLARLSGNRAVGLVLQALNDVVRSFMDVTYEQVYRRGDREAIRTAVGNHNAIVEAVVAGDPEAAAAAMHRHFAYVAEGDDA